MALSACARQAVVPASSTHPAVGKLNASPKTIRANAIKGIVNFIIGTDRGCFALERSDSRDIYTEGMLCGTS